MADRTSSVVERAPRIPPVVFLLSFVLLFITVVIAAESCSSVARTSWELTEPPNGRQLEISVQVGGCDVFDRTSVTETDSTVVVDAYVLDDKLVNCDDGIFPEQKTVELQAPLGNRKLHGCNPPSSKYQLPYLSDSDCIARVR